MSAQTVRRLAAWTSRCTCDSCTVPRTVDSCRRSMRRLHRYALTGLPVCVLPPICADLAAQIQENVEATLKLPPAQSASTRSKAAGTEQGTRGMEMVAALAPPCLWIVCSCNASGRA